ncbi:MAG: phosphatase PAP2 family protein [Halobacteriales archaeon]
MAPGLVTPLTRGVGGIGILRDLLPGWATPLVVGVTQLGDVWFVLALLVAVYWFRDRRRGALGLGLLFGAFGLTVALKAAFGLPRPPPGVRLTAVESYGFPSGHAIAATVAWGALALVLDAGSKRARAAVAGGVVAVVALSRVALGVHYVVDVLAGIAVGAGYLVVGVSVARGDPRRAFALAVGLGVVAVGASTAAADALVALGGAVGALAAWIGTTVPEAPWGRGEAVPAALGGGGAALAFVAAVELAPPPVGALLGAFAAGGVVGLPAVLGDQNVSR